MRKLSILLLLIVAHETTAQFEPRVLGFVLPEGKTKITVPIELHNNLVVMPVVVNGQLPMKFILDTGVRTAILTEKSYSDILKIPYSRQYTISGPGEKHTVTAYIANNISLYIPPGLKGEGHSMLVLEKDYLELRNYLGVEVHGILGYELFSRFVVHIDYQNKLVEFISPEGFKPKRKYASVPIVIEDTKPFVNTSVDMGRKKILKLLVDTGASYALLLDPDSDPDIQVPEKNVSTVIGRALGGEINGKIGRVAGVDLGRYTLPRVITNYPDRHSYLDTLKASLVKRNGSIGSELLSRFSITFDYAGGKIYLKKNNSFKNEFQNNLSGLTIKAKGARLRAFEIIDVRPNSVAGRIGLQKGDNIVFLNGSPGSTYTLSEINAIMNSKAGKKIVIEINRAGEVIKKTFTLEQDI